MWLKFSYLKRTQVELARAAALAAALMGGGCAMHTLHPYTSDACSLYPEGTKAAPNEWKDCCEAHDRAYWQGGTRKQRLAADEALRACVADKSQDSSRAARIFYGVRAGGSAAFPTPFRWGYGWGYGRGYEPLTDEERARVQAEIRREGGK